MNTLALARQQNTGLFEFGALMFVMGVIAIRIEPYLIRHGENVQTLQILDTVGVIMGIVCCLIAWRSDLRLSAQKS